MKKLLCAALLAACSVPASAGLTVLACEPEWAALATALGKDTVKVNSATTFEQDPHHIQARPSLIAKARQADIVVCSGADLEAGWLPLLLRKSNNRDIQPGKPGYFIATDYVELLGKTDRRDRADGDVHGLGNPHIHMHPDHMLTVANALTQRFSAIDPDQSEFYQNNLKALATSLETMKLDAKAQLAELNGKTVIVHHDNWVYLFDWLGLKQLATLEPKAGLPPSTAHLSALLKQFKDNPAYAIVYSSYQDPKPAHWLSKRSNTPAVMLPYSVDDWRADNALVAYYQGLIAGLLKRSDA